MGKLVDMTGQNHGRLRVISRRGVTRDGRASWLCECECGNMKTVSGKNIRLGYSLSCGCLHLEASLNNLPKNERPVGSRREKLGYVEIKTQSGWMREHVHVFEQYIGKKIPSGSVIHHKDEDKKNNSIENLELMSAGEHSTLHNKGRVVSEITKLRISRSARSRTRLKGHSGRKLTKDKVLEIRRRYVAGVVGYMTLAKEYEVTPATIRNIIKKTTWRYANG